MLACARMQASASLIAVATALSISAGMLRAQAPEDRRGQVGRDKMTFYFPLPYHEIQAPLPPVLGYYAWRVTIESEPKVSFVFGPVDPVRGGTYQEVVHNSTLRVCPSSTSSITECKIVMRGNGRLGPASVRIEVRDPAIIARMRKARPEAFWRTVIEPGGHYQVEQLLIHYGR